MPPLAAAAMRAGEGAHAPGWEMPELVPRNKGAAEVPRALASLAEHGAASMPGCSPFAFSRGRRARCGMLFEGARAAAARGARLQRGRGRGARPGGREAVLDRIARHNARNPACTGAGRTAVATSRR